MILEKANLSVVLNELYLSNRRIEVKFPPIIGSLYEISLDETCKIYPMQEEKYAEVRYKLSTEEAIMEEDIINEIPKPSEYRMTLYASGCLTAENYEDVKKELEQNAKRDLLRGHRPLYIGYDTNALMHRVPVDVSEILNAMNAKTGYALCTGVLEELHPKVDKKYNQLKIGRLKQRLKIKEFEEFFNQPLLNARMHRIGLMEYRKLKNNYYADEIKSEKGDLNIVRAYSKYPISKNNMVDILLFSGDNVFVEIAHDNRLKAIFVKQPKTIPSNLKVKWNKIVDLLFVSAIVFGYISVSGIKMFGIWRGKIEDDWNKERVCIQIKSEELKKEIERDIRIIGS